MILGGGPCSQSVRRHINIPYNRNILNFLNILYKVKYCVRRVGCWATAAIFLWIFNKEKYLKYLKYPTQGKLCVSNWGSQKEKCSKYSKYPTQGKTLCAMGWALSYDSNFPINILHCRGLDLLIYTLSCVFIKTKDHLSYFHLTFIMCINNSVKTNLTNTSSWWILSFFLLDHIQIFSYSRRSRCLL